MKSKALQYFSEDYLKNTKKMKAEQILSFLDDFRQLHGASSKKAKSKLISIKVPNDLLNAFKLKASLNNTPYQTLIKKLMKDYLNC